MRLFWKILLFLGIMQFPFVACAKLDKPVGGYFYIFTLTQSSTPLNNDNQDNSDDTEIQYKKSCLAILQGGMSSGDGNYTIYPDGTAASKIEDVYCDMTTDGGGWTRITLTLAHHSFSGSLTPVETANEQSGFDSDNKPYTRDDAGNHTYYYTVTIPFGFSAFYLDNYQIKANSAAGHTSEIGATAQSNWNLAYNSQKGDVSFGSGDDAGPLVSYASKGYADECESCTIKWEENQTPYNLSASTTLLRIGWGEAGPQYEGWYPWWSGYIFVR